MNGPVIMEDRIWEETVIPWLMGQQEKLLAAGMTCDLALREDLREELRPGLLFHKKEAEQEVIYFLSTEPVETDEGVAFLLRLSREKDVTDTERRIQEWRFPLPDFPELSGTDTDLFDYVRLYEKVRKDEGEAAASDAVPQETYELVRLNRLFTDLGRLGMDPVLERPQDAPPRIVIRDTGRVFHLSVRRIDAEEEIWILTALLYPADAHGDPEGEPTVRFDLPEFDGPADPESYGRFLEIMETQG